MRIAITGGSGSLGSALIDEFKSTASVVTFTRDEAKRRQMQQKHPEIKVYAGDVRDRERLEDIFSGCEVVVHAAARKVVSGHWDEPREMLKTNIEGTVNVLAAARKAGVKRVLFISSDKAVHPENAYGVSKAMGEHLVIAENARSHPKGTGCSVLRYGNVIGSRGSVIPVWCDFVRRGLPVPVTDHDMTRFWVPMHEAVSFVREAVSIMQGGETFVPILRAANMNSVLVMFRNAVKEIAGLLPDFTHIGIRPGGEKRYEELLAANEFDRMFLWQGKTPLMVVLPSDDQDLWIDSFPEPYATYQYKDALPYKSDSWYLRHSHDTLYPHIKAAVEAHL